MNEYQEQQPNEYVCPVCCLTFNKYLTDGCPEHPDVYTVEDYYGVTKPLKVFV